MKRFLLGVAVILRHLRRLVLRANQFWPDIVVAGVAWLLTWMAPFIWVFWDTKGYSFGVFYYIRSTGKLIGPWLLRLFFYAPPLLIGLLVSLCLGWLAPRRQVRLAWVFAASSLLAGLVMMSPGTNLARWHALALLTWGLVLIPVPCTWLMVRHRRGRYKDALLCKRCGYNLTGNVSGVCPECGTRIGSAAEGSE